MFLDQCEVMKCNGPRFLSPFNQRLPFLLHSHQRHMVKHDPGWQRIASPSDLNFGLNKGWWQFFLRGGGGDLRPRTHPSPSASHCSTVFALYLQCQWSIYFQDFHSCLMFLEQCEVMKCNGPRFLSPFNQRLPSLLQSHQRHMVRRDPGRQRIASPSL